MSGNMNQLPFMRRASAVVIAGLSFVACGDGETEPQPAAAPSSNNTELSEPVTGPSGSSDSEAPLVTFDDLGGGSSIIQVSGGPGLTEVDKTPTGTYNDGDTVQADCKEEGRPVDSAPSLGEQERQATEWVRLIGSPGVNQWATAVYLEQPLPQIPACDPDES